MTGQSCSRPQLLECSSKVNGADGEDKRHCMRNRPLLYLNIRHTAYSLQSCVEELAANGLRVKEFQKSSKEFQPYLFSTLTV